MKKRFVGWMVALGAVAVFAGCGNEADTSTEQTQVEDNTGENSAQGNDVSVPLHQMKVEEFVTLGDYANLNVTVDAIAVDDATLNELVNSVYMDGITAENGGIVDRAVAVGDTVIIDYEGKKDGVAFAGGTAQGADLAIGSGQFIPGFEDGLVGVMPGETVDLNLTFPENYGNAELAGQAVVFTVTVHYIRPIEIAQEDMQDAVVASLGIPNVATVEQLKQYSYDYLYSNAETNYNNNVRNGILDALFAQCEFKELPNELLQEYEEMMVKNIAASASAYGVDAETFANYFYGVSSEVLAKTYAEEGMKQNFALQAIANAEGLNISDEELEETLLKYAKQVGVETVEEYLGENSREDYRDYLMNEKVMAYLQEKATITENQ